MRQEACAAAREALPVESTETSAPTPDATIREGEMEGVLHVVGELGFRGASVRAVLEYSGGHRKQFYDHFESLEDCFAQAYEAWIDRLGVSLLEAAVSASGWRASVAGGAGQALPVRRRATGDRPLALRRGADRRRRGAGQARRGGRAAGRAARQRPRRDRARSGAAASRPGSSSSAASRPASATCSPPARRAASGTRCPS